MLMSVAAGACGFYAVKVAGPVFILVNAQLFKLVPREYAGVMAITKANLHGIGAHGQ